MNNINFFDNFFRFIFLLFWSMIWYKWVALSNSTVEVLMSTIFLILSVLYIVSFFIFYIKNKNIPQIVFHYRIVILSTFISSSISFLLVPTNIFLFYTKTFLIAFCIYLSYIKLFKYKIEEGLVGILSSILLLVITFLY